jgi:TonB family protein
MRNTTFFYIFIGFFAFLGRTTAQTAVDTTIYDVMQVSDTMPFPLIKSCGIDLHRGWNLDSVRRCAENNLLGILSRNIRYPDTARANNIQGTVVTTFVIETNGRMAQYKLLKDIGYGCGEEAIRVLKAFDELGLRWQPAYKNGKPVRCRQTVPLRFRLEETKPYTINALGDSVYVNVESYPAFKYGTDSLIAFTLKQLEYPDGYEDSCKVGIIEMSLLVGKDGSVHVENQLDFSNLGMDFQFQALRLANKTTGKWTPATYGGKPVATTMPLRVVFKSDGVECTAANARFDRTMLMADEGAQLFDIGKTEEAIGKWTEALTLSPRNTELLYYRGTALLNLNKKDEACKDWNAVRNLLGVTWFEPMRQLMCGY